MGSKFPKDGVSRVINGLVSPLTKHLLIGMILQVGREESEEDICRIAIPIYCSQEDPENYAVASDSSLFGL